MNVPRGLLIRGRPREMTSRIMVRPAEARERGHDDGCRNPQAQGLPGHEGRPRAAVAGLVDVLAEHRIGAVLVIDRTEQLLGIVSDATLCAAWRAMGRGRWR